jgi:hypothetical protein
MPRVGFEPRIPAFEWAKTVHAFDRAATVIGPIVLILNTKEGYGLHEYLPVLLTTLFKVQRYKKSTHARQNQNENYTITPSLLLR